MGRRSAQNSQAESTNAWLGIAEEVPAPKVEANKKVVSRQRFYRLFIIGTIVLLPFSLAGNFVAVSNITASDDDVQSDGHVNVQAKAEAILQVKTWLAQSPAPLAGGRFVSWDGFDSVDKPEPGSDSAKRSLPDYDQEVHRLTVVDGHGVQYRASVTVAIDPALGVHALYDPSVVPVATSSPGGWNQSNSPWYGMSSTSAPDTVREAVDTWVEAYTSGSSSKLRTAVGDGDASRAYIPLHGVKSAEVKIVSAAYLGAGGSHTSDQMLVQVELSLLWDGQSPPERDEKYSPVTYDLLLTGTESATPRVVSWGGAGTGLNLEPYGQAITGREPIAADDPSDSQSGSDESESTDGEEVSDGDE